jgi:GDP-mannose 6-dehydrogenase
MKMKTTIIGAGYVGSTMAACLLNDGHEVVIHEIDNEKSNLLVKGISPIYEPKVNELLRSGIENKRLSINPGLNLSLGESDILFVCVGTPSNSDGSLYIDSVIDVTKSVINSLHDGARSETLAPLLIVFRSTLPPGTMDNVIVPLFDDYSSLLGSVCELAFNPEFLREATAVDDYYTPPKIVIGERSEGAAYMLRDLYSKLKSPVFLVDLKTAELIKIIDNTWHGLKVAFANEVGRLCKSIDVKPSTWSRIFLSDTKLNISDYYMRPGGAFGGSCLPKDIKGVINVANKYEVSCPIINNISFSNELHKNFIVDSITTDLGKGSKILLLGLSFKKDTDDLRESPLMDLAKSLLNLDFQMGIYDPDLAFSNLDSLLSFDKDSCAIRSVILNKYSDTLAFSPDLIVVGKKIDSLDSFLGWGVRVIDVNTL